MNQKKDWIYITLLTCIAILSHLNWFHPFSVINFGDWLYFPDKAVSELWFSWGTWVSIWALGIPNIQTSFYPFELTWSLIANLGFSYDTATKITFFIPIALFGFISPYILARKLFKNYFASFVATLFYGSTTYFLIKQMAHIPIAFVYSLMPLVFFSFISALQNKKISSWLIFSMIFSLIMWYEVRITLLVASILLLYFIIFHLKEFKKHFWYISIAGLTVIALNIFWILPTIFTSVNASITEVASRGIFGDFLFDMQHAFTLVESSWTVGYANMEFVKQPVQWFYWFIPIIAFFPTFIIRKLPQSEKKLILFFLILALTGILLTKQSAHPFPWLYSFLYDHIPIFQLFREASKFYIFTAFGYFGLLGFSVKYGNLIFKELHITAKKGTFLISTIIILISGINLYPLVTQRVGTTFVSNPVPEEFKDINNEILADNSYYRTIWLESCCQYIAFDTEHPRVVGHDYILHMDSILNIQDYGENYYEKFVNFFNAPNAEGVLQQTSIKYIMIPIDESNSVDAHINVQIVKALSKKNFLSISPFSNKKLVVFENHSYAPHIYITKSHINSKHIKLQPHLEYKLISPTQYKIKIKNISEKVTIHFSDQFHPDWKIRIGDFDWYKTLLQKDYFLSDSFHQENDLKLNTFKIDPEYIKKNIDKKNYSRNNDGSINISITLYFAPQSMFYVGNLISGTTLTFLIALFIFTYGRKSIKKITR